MSLLCGVRFLVKTRLQGLPLGLSSRSHEPPVSAEPASAHSFEFTMAYNRGRLENKAAFIVRSAGPSVEQGKTEAGVLGLSLQHPELDSQCVRRFSGPPPRPRAGLDRAQPTHISASMAGSLFTASPQGRGTHHPLGGSTEAMLEARSPGDPVESLVPSSWDRRRVYQHDPRP